MRIEGGGPALGPAGHIGGAFESAGGDGALRAGRRVRVVGVGSKPELNGRVGVVMMQVSLFL